ncbi:MAG: DUF3858 domain-containing protein, partial [Planctomycetota bacterium]
VLKCDTNHVEANFELAIYYLNDMFNRKKAEKYLEAAMAVNPDFMPGILMKLDILSRRGMALESTMKFLKLANSGKEDFNRNSRVLLEAAEYYKNNHQAEKAIATYKKAIQSNYFDWSAHSYLLNLYKNLDKFEEALTECNNMTALFRYDTNLLYERARIFVALDKLEDALTELDRALAICPEDENIIIEKAKLLFRLSVEKGEQEDGETYAEGKSCLESALKINPSNTWLRRYLEFIDKERKSFEDSPRFAASVDVRESIVSVQGKKLKEENAQSEANLEDHILTFNGNAIAAEAKKENLPYVCLLFDRISKITKDGTASDFFRVIVKITSEDGTRRLRRFPVLGNWWHSQVRTKLAQVIHEDGTKEEAKTSGASVTFPPLKVGDILIVEQRFDQQISDLSERFFGDYYSTRFFFHFKEGAEGNIMPVQLSRFTLILPEDREFFFNCVSIKTKPRNEAGIDNKTIVRVYEAKNLTKVIREFLAPPDDQILPCVEISTFGDWKKFGTWFYHLTKKQFDSSPEIKEKVIELTKNCKTEMEKIRAIYNFVITDIRYQQWEFGIHGWQPYKTSVIFARKNGDCKDKSLLINSMLAEIGIKSCLTLIRLETSRGEPDMTLPVVSHFNHCISYVPASGDRPGMFLDGTAEHYGITDAPTCGDWGAVTLVVDENGGDMKQVPLPNPDNYIISEKADLTLNKDGSAKAKITVFLHGDMAAHIRQSFSVEGMQKTIIEKVYGQRFGGAKAISVTLPDLNDLNIEILELSFELEIPNFSKNIPEGFALTSNLSPMLIPWSQVTPEEKREFKMVLPYLIGMFPVSQPIPGTTVFEYTYTIPKSLRVVTLPQNENFDSAFANFQLEFSKEEGNETKIFIKRKLTLRENVITTENYSKLRELMNIMEKAQNENVVVKKKDEKQSK